MENMELVKSLYAAFSAGDQEHLSEILDPDVEWIQNEGFPGGGTHIGSAAVLEGVFGRLTTQWSEWRSVVDRWLDAGDSIVALGRYVGTHRKTGRSMIAAFAHVYWVGDGRITRFEQYTDTAKIVEAAR